MVDTTFTGKVRRPDPDTLTVASGGNIDVETGGELRIAGVAITATAAEINAAAGTGVSSTELDLLDGAIAGTAVASKALALGATKNVDTLVIADGGLYLGAGAGTSVTATAAELNYNDIATLGTGAASKAVVLSAGDDFTWPAAGILTAGEVRTVGKTMFAQGAPAAKTVTAAITAAELAGGLITTTGVTGPSVHQLPTGTLLLAEFPGAAAGMAFDFTVINTGVGAADDATITVNTDVTIVGNPTVGALTDATIISGSGRFRARYTGGVTFIVYRVA